MEFNEAGYAFVPDKELTKYVQEDRLQWGGIQKGIPAKYIVVQVHHKTDGHVNNLLFDTETQQPVDEIGLGWSCWSKLDLIKLAFNTD